LARISGPVENRSAAEDFVGVANSDLRPAIIRFDDRHSSSADTYPGQLKGSCSAESADDDFRYRRIKAHVGKLGICAVRVRKLGVADGAACAASA
jgi:hypothetical protein